MHHSNAEAKYRAMTRVVRVHSSLKEIGLGVQLPMNLYGENQATIASNTIFHEMTKQMRLIVILLE